MNITGGIYKGRKITSPDEKITRPTLSKTRMGVFNTLYSLINSYENLSFLDLFGGSGIMGLEALSRGFGKVTVCELNKKSAQIIKSNYASLGLKPDLYIGDSLKLLNKFPQSYDVTYIDPPFNSGIYKKIINQIKSGIIIAESDINEDFSEYTVIKEKIYGSVKITFIKK